MSRRSPLAVIFFTVFLDLLGFGIVIPVAAFYVKAHGPHGMSAEQLGSLTTWLGSSYSFAQFLFAPIWGRLSDRVGRRPIILISVTGSCLSYLLFGFARTLPVLYLSRVLAGIMAANISTAQAYVADVTTPEDRTKGMGMIGAAFGLGFVFGPAISFLISRGHEATPAVPFLASALAALNLVLAFFLLPESRKPGVHGYGRREFGWKPVWHALNHPRVGQPILMFFISTLAFAGMEWTLPPFLIDRFGLTQRGAGMLFVYLGLMIAFVQGGLVRRMAKGSREPQLLVLGTMAMIPGLALVPSAHTRGVLMGVLALLAFGQGITSPSASSLISKSIDESEQGAILGVNQSMSSLARAVGPFAAGWLIRGSGSLAAPFLAAGSVMVLAFLISLRVMSASRSGALKVES